MSTSTSGQALFERLKRKILGLGFARPGSVCRRFLRCSQAKCRCKATPPTLHGPYYQWTRKEHGKTVSKSLTAAQAKLCAQWQRNQRRMRAILHRIEALSLRETDRQLRATARARKRRS